MSESGLDLGRPRSFLTASAEVRVSRLGGKGVFAVRPIAEGELVAIWGGGTMTYDELMSLPDEVNGFAIQVWGRWFVGPRSLEEVEPSDYVNHSCEPNCGVRGETVVVARRGIQPDEEITYDYGTTDALGPTMLCNCGASSCRKVVTSNDWRDPEFQARNEGFLSAWVEHLVRTEGTHPRGLAD